jgi:hypothetical protein
MTTLCVTRTIKRLIFKDCACRMRLTGGAALGTPNKKPLRSNDLRGSLFEAWR